MNGDLLIITSKKEIQSRMSNLVMLDRMIRPKGITLIGDAGIGELISEIEKKCKAVICFIDSDMLGSVSEDDLIIEYSKVCEYEYYLYWDLDIVPTQCLDTEYMGQPVFFIGDSVVDRILHINTEVMKELSEARDYTLTAFGNYYNYVVEKYPELYVTGEVNVLAKAALFFNMDEISDVDLNWLAKDYDLLIFEKEDSTIPEYSFFFHDEKYREKLSAKQIYEAVKVEVQLEGDTSSVDEEDALTSFEYGFLSLIKQEMRRGNDIIICPLGSEGEYFKQLLNDKFGIKEKYILDDELSKEREDIIGYEELAGINLDHTTIIVNSGAYEDNMSIVLKLHDILKGARVISPYGAYETIVPARHDFIEKVRELTEVKMPITDRPYVRVGSDNDGGYIMLEDFSEEMRAYSYGINNDVSWDKQMADSYGMDIYMYDHTIDGLPEDNCHFHYFKKGIAGHDIPEELLYSLATCLSDNGHIEEENMILKMDVEGAEWDMINDTSSEVLGKFAQIVFELHDFDHPEKEKQILSALEKMNKTHFPVWIHGNNHVSAICTEEIILPTAIEILYLNRKKYTFREASCVFPWELDAPNTEVFPEYLLGNWGMREIGTSMKADTDTTSTEGNMATDYDSIKSRLLDDIDFIGELNDRLLCVPSVFGPKDRVYLSPAANMQNSIINTMSGRVYVDDNTFCGHNVSIITGSHDATRFGEDRMQFPCEGNDIVIGKGVWLCSNAVILGPCQIGDNAVVAAGSVVLPGTMIKPGEVWAGIPAKFKKNIRPCLMVPEKEMKGPAFDTIIVITPKDYQRVASNYKRLLDNLPSQRLIFVGNAEVGELVKRSGLGDRAGFICEDDIIPFDEVNKVMYEHLKDWLGGHEMPRGFTGWYYQQFLKMQYAYISSNDYYMSWDGDTIPCKRFEMFKDNGVPYMDYKHEYHAPYFETMSKLIPGLRKLIGPSFISEHMLFSCNVMKQLIEKIESNNDIPGDKFYEKIIHSIEPKDIQDSYFSEFETYGSFVCLTNPSMYGLREWHSFRLAGQFFDPDSITDSDYEWLSQDFEAVSFEKGMTVREDHKNLFDNKEYQAKLSARQMLEIAQEEFKDGYKEVWE